MAGGCLCLQCAAENDAYEFWSGWKLLERITDPECMGMNVICVAEEVEVSFRKESVLYQLSV